MSTCIFENIYLESAEFLKISIHTSAIISMPVSLLGFYMILFKTPEQMKLAKMYILNVHMWVVLLDFYLCFLCTPLFLYPAFARIGFGLFQYFGVSMIFETITGMVFIGFTAFAIMPLFESRFYIICDFPGRKYWKFLRHVWLYGHYILFILVSFSLYFSFPDQDMALKRLMENIPCLPDYLKSAPIFVIVDKTGFQVVFTTSTVFTVMVEVTLLFLFLVLSILKMLKDPRVSRKIVQVHKIFLMSLLLQTTVPLITIAIPLMYIYYSVYWDYYNQFFNNIGIACMSTHGFLSTIVMIMVHRPYRETLFAMIGKSKTLETTVKVSMRTTKIDVIRY